MTYIFYLIFGVLLGPAIFFLLGDYYASYRVGEPSLLRRLMDALWPDASQE